MERAWAVARNLISRYSLLWEMFLSSVFVSLIVTYLKVRDFFFLFACFILNQDSIFIMPSHQIPIK